MHFVRYHFFIKINHKFDEKGNTTKISSASRNFTIATINF